MKPRALAHRAWRRTLHNLPQKLLAVLAALGLWFVATSDRRDTIERSFATPLQINDETANAPQGERRSVTGVAARTVRVTMRGPRNQLLNLSGEDIEASISVTGQPAGAFQVPVRVRAPGGFQVVRFDPASVSGFIDSEITRTLGVQLATTNLPERALPTFELTPRTVQVSGAQRVVQDVASVATVPVSLPRGATAEVRLIAIDATGRPVTDVRLSPATVNVARTDSADLPIKTVDVELPEPPAGLEVVSAELSPPRVRILGDQQTLANLSAVTARVNYRAGQYSARASLKLPAGARSLETVTITLDVRRRAETP
ncbi:CdaR family protein [Deinococcus peraridilitoris]|uniref:YbbR-like protein n=1 Tax=Deinococcus peraridilitoris (strain DSM 19664 / LMG 22246 / CIP 109416 / KR-200) TaxID=937777 RepID=L0A346_DEIPD|nr:hypothetical protein [Deinococcus peraridilitoris]AFZ67869.1 hypothetical protein Deipe_2393 [Deinococcus peraridilitoris DSM 19664]